MHLLKNGHPAHVFTDEDRRKAAAATNRIRREKREIAELMWLNQGMDERLAAREARLRRKREQQRARRTRIAQEAQILARETHRPSARRSTYGSSAATGAACPSRAPDWRYR
jgi:hypothetical protein